MARSGGPIEETPKIDIESKITQIKEFYSKFDSEFVVDYFNKLEEPMAKLNGKPKFDNVMLDKARYKHSVVDGKLKIRKKESKKFTAKNMRRED